MIRRAGEALPRGWSDLGLQLGIWFGFIAAYQVARGLADRGVANAFENGRAVIDVERALHSFVEADVQRAVLTSGGFLVHPLNWTYWVAQFAVVGLALLWIYLFRHDAFARVRNWLIAANLIGLVGYVLIPTAPPRMFPEWGFVDTLSSAGSLNHGSALVEIASNPFAAMPSLHAADALIVGIALATLVRPRWLKVGWALWPAWVAVAVVATGNHFWLDIAAGALAAGLAYALLVWHARRRTPAPTFSTAH